VLKRRLASAFFAPAFFALTLAAHPILSSASAQTTLAPQALYDSQAPSAIMLDAQSGAVLYAKNADVRVPPASMAKIMTVYVAFDMLRQGLITLDDKVTVADDTWRKWNNQGSTMFLSPGEQVSVGELLHGIITLSGNDACVVLAEGLAGSEPAFVTMMNKTAAKLGLRSSNFMNTTGWPDPDQYVTPRDLAVLGRAITRDFPELYQQFYSVREYSHGKQLGSGASITQGNRNPLLGKVAGADGIKTGHTDEAGYGFVGSAQRNGMRLVSVVTGMPNAAARAQETIRFMEWGLRTFQSYPIAKKGRVMAQIPVHLGKDDFVAAVVPYDITATLTRFSRRDLQVKVVYNSPLKAPIRAGQPIGQLVVRAPGSPPRTITLTAQRGVEARTGLSKAFWRLGRLFGGTPAAPAS
jgi:serine-type D-Ala-D-Ala carboxypeptidase (penicillin-binding protein 5/6)